MPLSHYLDPFLGPRTATQITRGEEREQRESVAVAGGGPRSPLRRRPGPKLVAWSVSSAVGDGGIRHEPEKNKHQQRARRGCHISLIISSTIPPPSLSLVSLPSAPSLSASTSSLHQAATEKESQSLRPRPRLRDSSS
jgi:hypothetical protein